MMNKQSKLSKSILFLFLTTLYYCSSHAITNRKLLDLKSQIEIKTSSSIFGQMLPKGVPIPPSAPSCRSSPGTPPSCPFPQPEMVDDDVVSLTP
uniref:Putative ovule protein n=1 Tax=Solanum chacoense TaxID=4108 RepID=A0A0V0GGW9_SOLCH